MRVTFQHLADIEGAPWDVARTMIADDLRRMQTQVNRTWEVSHLPTGEQRTSGDGIASGTIIGTLSEQPTGLGARHAGLMYFVTDYGHWVRWTGANWQFADDSAGYFQDFAITPQGSGWALCDGSSTSYLVVGGSTLTSAAFITPNLTGSGGAFRKGYPSYSGPSVTAAGSTGAAGAHDHGGTTDGSGAVPVTGTTDSESAHTHAVTVSGTTGVNTSAQTTVQSGVGATVAHQQHSHVISEVETSAAGSAHSHGAGSLEADDHSHAIDGESDHSHTAGDPRHLGVLPFFRR